MNFTPFSQNIIFVDTEFSGLDPYKGEILSIGLIKLNGEELYLELEYNGEVNDFVKQNVLPYLTEQKVSRAEAVERIKNFVGNDKSFMVSYVNQFDVIYLYKLLGFSDSYNKALDIDRNPFHWLPIDFASILFGIGISPEAYNHLDKDNFYKELGIDHTKYREHHALDDAKLLREVYLKIASK